MSETRNSERQLRIITYFSWVGIICLLAFSGLEWISGGRVGAVIELVAVLVSVLNLILVRTAKNAKLSGDLLLVVMIIVLAYLFLNGGIDGTGIFWLCTFPLLAFFVKGKCEGLLWNGIIIIAVAVVGVCSYFGHGISAYSYMVLRQFFAAYIAISLIMYFFQDSNDIDWKLMEEAQERALLSNRQLEHEIAERKNVQDLASKRTKDLEDTKLATLNLLEDLGTEKTRIQELQAKDEAILSGIGDAVFAVDAKGIIILFNAVAELLSGVSAESATGKHYSAVLNFRFEDSNKENFAFIVTALSGKKTSMASHTIIIRADGVATPVSDSAAPIFDEARNVTGAVVVFRDVTIERQIDRAKTEFVSLASHQLRTPLTAIGWYAEMLLSGDAGALNENQKDQVQEISDSNKRMVDLVNSLLNVSRIDLGTFAVDPKPVVLKDLAESVLSELRPQTAKRQTQIVEEYDPAIPEMNLDPQLTRMIFQNLLSNAIKYTPEKGTVTLSTHKKAKTVEITVADNGYGIPKADQGKIFTKLFRADNAQEKDPDGNGLGLYILKAIIEQSKGKISFESEEGKGTTFHIELPLTGMTSKQGSKPLA